MASVRPYRVIVWGSNGFTGRLVSEHLVKDYADSAVYEQGQFKWAMAGRNREKVEATRSELMKSTPDAGQVEVVIANTEDKASLDRMVSSTDVLISMVGPYDLHDPGGGALNAWQHMQACVEAGTHYCDITGEPQFIRHSIETHHAASRAKSCKIVHCCGFDSVPSEVSTLLAVDHLDSRYGIKTDRSEMFVMDAMGSFSGGTLESGLGLMRTPADVRKKAMHPYAFDERNWDKPMEQVVDKGLTLAPKRSKLANMWGGPFIMAPVNEPVVRRSNALLQYGPKFSYEERQSASNPIFALLGSLVFIIAAGLLPLAARFSFIRNLLPQPGTGGSRETMEKGHWHVANFASGIDSQGVKKVAEAHFKDMHRDPGYLSTSRMILECALCLALQPDALAHDKYASRNPGGVLNPASALGLVLVERLKKSGYEMSVRDASGSGATNGKKIE